MASAKEVSERRKDVTAVPVETVAAMGAVEAAQGVAPLTLTPEARTTLGGATDGAVGVVTKCFKSVGALTKSVFGGIANIFSVFKVLGDMIRNI
jgi:hypothetical protein